MNANNGRKRVMWVEKYRPKTLDEMVGQNKIRRYFSNIINNGQNLNHYIFVGKSGVGKTTLARILADTLNADFLEFNASDDRSITFIRNKIIPAMRSVSLRGRYKIIFLDETENLMADAMNCLKSPMEKYSHNAKLIFACNDMSNINSAIRSRCIIFQFAPISNEEMKSRLLYIAEKEGVDVDDDILNYICEKSHGDMRIAINLLEKIHLQGFEKNDFGLILEI